MTNRRFFLKAAATAPLVLAAGPVLAAAHAGKMTAADLRVTLNLLLAEHVNLAAAATGWAMAGRTKQFKAAAGALDANSVDIAGAIGLVYGDGARDAFLPLWRKHIGFFVDYTTAVIAQNGAAQKKAVADLMGYAEDFGAFLNAANPNLPADAVAALVREHAVTVKGMVDAQANQDWADAYAKQRAAAHHMQMISNALADAIAAQFPDRFTM